MLGSWPFARPYSSDDLDFGQGFKKKALPPPPPSDSGSFKRRQRSKAGRGAKPEDRRMSFEEVPGTGSPEEDPPRLKVDLPVKRDSDSEGCFSPGKDSVERVDVSDFIREPAPRTGSWKAGSSSSSSGWKKAAEPPEPILPPDLLSEVTDEVVIALSSNSGTFFNSHPWVVTTRPKSAATPGETPWVNPVHQT